MIKAGDLRHEIIIQQSTETQGSYGDPVETWYTFATVWANIKPLKGRMLFAAQAVNPKTNTEIEIRYLCNLSTKYRILFGTRIYLPTQPPINIDERNISMRLMVEEVF